MILTTARRRAGRRAGFTLLEVLVVVAILVILSTIAIISTMNYLETARKNRAQLQCQSLAGMVETYYVNPQSGNQYPNTLQDLVNPPFGGGSMLKNGQDDLKDPWGNEYVLMPVSGDGVNQTPIVMTTAKDGTPISQHGVGQRSKLQ